MMPDGQPELTPEEVLVLKTWRDAGPYSTITLKKHDGRLSHGEVTTKLEAVHALREQVVPGRPGGDPRAGNGGA